MMHAFWGPRWGEGGGGFVVVDVVVGWAGLVVVVVVVVGLGVSSQEWVRRSFMGVLPGPSM